MYMNISSWAFSYVFLLTEITHTHFVTDFGLVLLDNKKEEHYRTIQNHPKERHWTQGLFFLVWCVISLQMPNFNIFVLS